MFQRFLKRDFVGVFCGKTTLPLDLDGKQLIVFGLDRNNRDIVGPLLAAILHMVVTRNVSRTVPRKDPLVVALDELPTLYLPALVNWLNENREDGFVGILGYQNIAQLEKVYGKELARAILGGTATKFIFNPQDPESAKLFSDYLGEMEIKFNSKSRSTGKGGGSRSTNEHHQKRHLLEPAQFAKMGTGRAVIINPAYTRGSEAYVPLLQSVKVPAADIAQMNWSEGKWDFVRERLIQNNSLQISDDERSQQFLERRELAQKLFPVPEQTGDLLSPEELANVF
jgi:type IV secretory pathway TraG/TraD family ATPase VirD4